MISGEDICVGKSAYRRGIVCLHLGHEIVSNDIFENKSTFSF